MTDKKENHLSRLRTMLRVSMALYVNNNEGVDDSHLMGALSAVLCEALIVREVPLEPAIETIRKTYEVVEMEMAMREKEESSVQ
jgi:hypothetical protein